MVEMLPGDILDEILAINWKLEQVYQLKELFLDIVNQAEYDDCKEQILVCIDLCRETDIEEFIETSRNYRKLVRIYM